MRQRPPKVSAIAVAADQAFLEKFDGRLGISVDEACQALGVGRDLLYQLIAKGEPEGLTVSQIGRRTIVHVASIHRLLRRTVATSLRPRVRRVRHGAETPTASTP